MVTGYFTQYYIPLDIYPKKWYTYLMKNAKEIEATLKEAKVLFDIQYFFSEFHGVRFVFKTLRDAKKAASTLKMPFDNFCKYFDKWSLVIY